MKKTLTTPCATIGLTSCVGPNGSGPLLSATGASILERSGNPAARFFGYLLGSAGQRQNAIDAQIQTQIQLTTTTPYNNPAKEQKNIGHNITISKWIDINKDGHTSQKEVFPHNQGPLNLDGAGMLVDFKSQYQGPTRFRITDTQGNIISQAEQTKTTPNLYLHIPAGSPLGLQENEGTNKPGVYNLEVIIGTETTSKQITIERGTYK